MTFEAADARAAAKVIRLLGESVEYHTSAGVVTSIYAVIDKDIQPTGYESMVSEARKEISVLVSDAPHIKRGEFIVSDVKYTVRDILENDGVVIRVSAK